MQLMNSLQNKVVVILENVLRKMTVANNMSLQTIKDPKMMVKINTRIRNKGNISLTIKIEASFYKTIKMDNKQNIMTSISNIIIIYSIINKEMINNILIMFIITNSSDNNMFLLILMSNKTNLINLITVDMNSINNTHNKIELIS